jgi:hypothetical protein
MKKSRAFVVAHQKWIFVGVSVAIILVGCSAVGVLALKMNTIHRANLETKTQLQQAKDQPIVQSQPDTTVTPDATNPVDTSANDIPAAAPTTTPKPSTDPSFRIQSAKLEGAKWSCGPKEGIWVSLPSVVVNATNATHGGGTFTWRLETTIDDDQEYVTTLNFPARTASYSLEAPWQPGYIYIPTEGKVAKTIKARIHVTAPNEVTSPWFTIPSSAFASCS